MKAKYTLDKDVLRAIAAVEEGRAIERNLATIQAGWPPLILAMAAMLDLGPGPNSKWSEKKFTARIKKVMNDISELHEQATAGL